MNKLLIDKLIKNEIKNLVRIKDTFDDRFDYLRLDKKERLFPFAENLLHDFQNSITFEDLAGYAELGQTYNLLANYLEVEKEQIFLAAGSDLSIKSVYEACIEKGDHIVLHTPCYAMFHVYGNMFGADMSLVPLSDNWKIDINKMLSCVKPTTKMLAIENPNGSVGTMLSFQELEYVASVLLEKNILFLIDEAYIYVHHQKSPAIPLIEKYPNVVITQTFSKGHGLAGLRMGYLVGNKDLIQQIAKVRPMHEITSLTAKTTNWLLENPELLQENQEAIKQSKKYLLAELSKLRLEAKDSEANFVLIRFPNTTITQELHKHKVLIRRPFEDEILKGWSLVTVGGIEHAKKLIEVLENILT